MPILSIFQIKKIPKQSLISRIYYQNQQMLTFPNAKINIGLNIIEKRTDGFHNIESLFYPVQWSDILEIIPSEKPIPTFQSSGLAIPGEESSNLCLKAYQLLKDKISGQAPLIHLHKIIPMGAGLGGGSADGAFTLKMLNEIYSLGLTNEELKDLARKLGSDCAFFIDNKPVFCFEKGDRFEDFDLDLSQKFIVLVNPDIHISTAEAYSGVTAKKSDIPLKSALKEPIHTWKSSIKNDFEEHLLLKYPALSEIKETLYAQGALYASMTGSGSTVYGIFENTCQLQDVFPSYTVWNGTMS